MPDKPVSPQSVGKAVVTFFRSLAFAGFVVGSAALFAVGCTDDSGNGHFIPPSLTGGAGGAGGGTGGDSAGGSGGDGAGGAAR